MVKSKFNESHLKILYSAETDGLYYGISCFFSFLRFTGCTYF